MRQGIVAIAALLSGCALAPDTVRVEVDHVSHATQHEPFTDHPTNYGFNAVAVTGHWRIARGAFLELSEGYVLERKKDLPRGQSCGALYGGHEIFQGRFGWEFNIK